MAAVSTALAIGFFVALAIEISILRPFRISCCERFRPVQMIDRRRDDILGLPPAQGLYLPEYEHDACGVGFVCHIKGKASNSIVDNALTMLERMNHRGACGCEPDSGDGAGILVSLPDKFLRREMNKKGITLPKFGQYGVAQVFLPKDTVSRNECIRMIQDVVDGYEMKILGW